MTTDELLDQMAVLMQFNTGWDARAQGCDRYANAPTATEAMMKAIQLRTKNKAASASRVRVKVEPESRPPRPWSGRSSIFD